MAQSIVGEKSLVFAKRIAKCYVFLKDKKGETVMSKQPTPSRVPSELAQGWPRREGGRR